MKEPSRMAKAKAAFEKAKNTYHPSLERWELEMVEFFGVGIM